jgi:hypothetical protein
MTEPSDQPFGRQLYVELRRLNGYHLLMRLLDLHEIQRLKVADRLETVKLFTFRCSYESLQKLEASTPAECAQFMVDEARRAMQNYIPWVPPGPIIT